MTALEQFQLSENTDFQKKVRMLMLKIALSVSGEDNTNNKDIYINKRANSAKFTIYNQRNAVDILAFLITSSDDLTPLSLDSEIEAQILSVWNDYSGLILTDTEAA